MRDSPSARTISEATLVPRSLPTPLLPEILVFGGLQPVRVGGFSFVFSLFSSPVMHHGRDRLSSLAVSLIGPVSPGGAPVISWGSPLRCLVEPPAVFWLSIMCCKPCTVRKWSPGGLSLLLYTWLPDPAGIHPARKFSGRQKPAARFSRQRKNENAAENSGSLPGSCQNIWQAAAA